MFIVWRQMQRKVIQVIQPGFSLVQQSLSQSCLAHSEFFLASFPLVCCNAVEILALCGSCQCHLILSTQCENKHVWR